MPCSCSAAMCAGTSRRASRPPWIFGCSVFTRPSSISGNPVWSATSVTGRPASASSFAVPPVNSSSTPSPCSSRANSRTPVLSETERRAVNEVMASLDQFMVDELAAQRVAVDAQPFGGAALIAFGVPHHHVEQRLLDHVEDHLVHRRGLHAAQVLEVALEAVTDAFFDVLLAHACCSRTSSLAAGSASGSRRCMSASSSNQWLTARTCASQLSSRFIAARNDSPPGNARTAQPMCLRALRTPANSPYRP